MPFVPAVNVVQVTCEQTYTTQPLANVIHCAFASAPNITSMQALATTIADWFDITYSPLVHIGWRLDNLRLRDITTQNGIVIEVPTPGVVGGLTGTPLPASVAMCLSLRTVYAGRSQRGRFYVSGLTAAYLEGTNNNLFAAAGINSFITALNTLRTTLAGAQQPWAVVSRYTNNAPRVTALINPVTSIISTDAAVDSQRGRTKS